ncbi:MULTISPECIES: SDR family NAD(P)-dependent oxidoreductase [Mycolicibacterium]|jgi:3-oxoacyl-[acyl-carrier protein] reductase|uniref:3-oxoacyl-[acyl-carrier-protein] reductase MabA n=2 Tax=Mycolicibacterium TaxID=1866885 RepID=A0A378TCB7_9MYCO|nr:MULTISPECIES: SDR family NAD(P)-dependent oxidoreductase [Mycolicibacterium]ANW63735.1 3-oxoacyl-ACP reductase [Mycobacterium sp. djl-10]MCV7181509.1 SDR family oxidoreductase [Mycolicibacterium murale]STZ57797.1 3-oxoacyl-ACP reductase [Mycolicibacterium tokaiense]BBY87680.1 beta-ketoacyl-ACP reductase [Mycolicibacterium tokaiense]GFG61042.1 beta-ketoacyl-ACP reductase [Mycolicibacterium murale]
MGNLTYDFSGRSVIVTGAARGIGFELGSFFAGAGAATYMIDVDADELTDAAKRAGGVAVMADVRSTEDVKAAVATVIEDTGKVDVVVNNAGVLRDKVVWKLTDEDWDEVMAVHAGGTFRFTRECVPHFRERNFGRIINITSFTGLRGNPGQSNYGMAKAGIIGFTKTTAKELARFGVTVNAIAPNAETRMIASIPADKKAEMTKAIPLGRFAQPSEMCPAIGFLASEEAGFITGTVLSVDGGMSM